MPHMHQAVYSDEETSSLPCLWPAGLWQLLMSRLTLDDMWGSRGPELARVCTECYQASGDTIPDGPPIGVWFEPLTAESKKFGVFLMLGKMDSSIGHIVGSRTYEQ